MLEVKNISVGYGVSEVVKDISFTLREGAILAIVGANGAGKTTLMKSLNGTLPILKGDIQLKSKSLKDHSRREIAQNITVIAQENETKFPVTVVDFVLAGRFARGGKFGWETEQDVAIAMKALDECDLSGYEQRIMNQLSGGERQRVILARALATEADVLLLDEPTANLDLPHQMLMFWLVKEKCAARNSAAIIITHDLNLSSEFADEILLLKKGRVFAKGAPKTVLTSANIEHVFGIGVLLDGHPVSGKPRVTMSYDF